MNARDDDQYDDTLGDDDLDTVGVDDENYDDSSDDAWEGEPGSDEGAEDDAPPPKKKGGLSNLIIIGLGVLAFFGFVYFKFSALPPAASVSAEQIVTETPAEPAPVEAQTTTISPENSLPVAPIEMTDPAAASRDSVTGTVAAYPDPSEAPPVNVADIGVPPVTEEASVVPSAPDAATSTPSFTTVPSVTPGAETATPVVASVPTIPGRQEQASSSVQQDQGQGSAPEIPMVAAAPTPEAASQQPSVPMEVRAASLSAASGASISGPSDDRVTKLEADLAALQVKISDAAPSAQMGEIAVQLKKISDRLAALEKKKTPQGRNSTPSTESRSRTESKEDIAALAPIIQKSSVPSYRLRAVAQGRAYLAQPGHAGLISVQVGDKLDGLGRVQKIMQQNGAWVVVGTEGRVRQ